MKSPNFLSQSGRILNSHQSRSLVLYGNIHDIFPCKRGSTLEYLNLPKLLEAKWGLRSKVIINYEPNGLIRIPPDSLAEVEKSWDLLRGIDRNDHAIKEMLDQRPGNSLEDSLSSRISSMVGNTLGALEILRQLTMASRGGHLKKDVIVIIENADICLPEGDMARLGDSDRFRIGKVQQWLSEPSFVEGNDSVVLVSSARGLISHRITGLPQVLSVEVGSPDEEERSAFIEWFDARQPDNRKLKTGSLDKGQIASLSAGLSLFALQQLLKGASYQSKSISAGDVLEHVEKFICDRLGHDVVEFKKPEHSLKDIVGASNLRVFLQNTFIPRIRSTESSAFAGAAVAGPIGSGKSFIFEAVAGELGVVVLVLKNLRSQYFGQTDVIFEKLRDVLRALGRALIFVDEADTQFGGVDKDAHATERRLTGKIQAMMSDPSLKGRVTWLLLTARIHLLSPDIRRPGRAGSLIIPVLDPEGEDLLAFAEWVLRGKTGGEISREMKQKLVELMGTNHSAASFAQLRDELAFHEGDLDWETIQQIVSDLIPPNIAETREEQKLHALINCTRRSLLPPEFQSGDMDEHRKNWRDRLENLL